MTPVNPSDDRRRHHALAGATALLAKLPLRALDLQCGRIGHAFRHDSEGDRDLARSRAGAPIKGRLAPEVTRYLDAVLLQDADRTHLWTLYAERGGQAFFGNPTRNGSLGENWLWVNMTREPGQGPHIVRSLIYEAFDDDLDLGVARALCGNRTAASGEPYDINGDSDSRRRRRALDRLGVIDHEMQAEGEIGLA